MIAWPERIDREWPFLEPILQSAPTPRLLDLGSGTGEHARFLASKGFAVEGIDSSASMIERSLDEPLPEGVRFIRGDISEVESLVSGTFGGAMCMGNTLPHLLRREQIETLAYGLRSLLLQGAPLVLQILNYDRIIAKKERFLPLNFRADPEGQGTVVFLRLMDPRDDGVVIFMPSTLLMNPESEEPLRVVDSRRVELRGWQREELQMILSANGFERFESFGSFQGAKFEDRESRDLILVARRA